MVISRYKNIMVLLLMLAIIPTAKADLTLDTSCNTTTGYYQELLHNGSSLLINNSFVCPNSSCARNALECNTPERAEVFMALGIGFAIIAFSLIYLSQKVGDEFWPLSLLFLMFGIVYMLMTIYLLSGFSELTKNSLNDIVVGAYSIGIWLLLGVFAYFIYLWVKHVLESMQHLKKGGRPFKPW